MGQSMKKTISSRINLPEDIKKYFWDCDFNKLSWEGYSFFITERILNFGNMDDIKWLLGVTDRDFIKKVVTESRNLNKKTSNFWRVMYEI